MDILSSVKEKAKKLQKRIVYPESFDDRILQAVEQILREKLARPVLLGNRDEIMKQIKELNLSIESDQIEIIDRNHFPLLKSYQQELFRLRQDKGLTFEEAGHWLENHDYLGVMCVQRGEADGMISGAVGSTANTIRPALQILKTNEKFHKVSGIFFMVLDEKLLLFADCAVNIDPNSHDLADIAIDTALTAKRFGIDPKVAMLSFSTMGSGKHPLVDKVREATEMAKAKRPDLLIEGEMQVDAALVPEICARKFPTSRIMGNANILIFPDLQSANIAYKLVERLGDAKAIGPILQGLSKPVNDLSRGCSSEDIVNLTAFTACETEPFDYRPSA